jgi:general secretion pathway protein B
MSYILEALKKSQQERELGQVPTLDATGIFSEDKEPVPVNHWGLLAVGLASLAVVIALFAALRGPTPPPVSPTVLPVPASQNAASLLNPAPESAPPVTPLVVEAPPPKRPYHAPAADSRANAANPNEEFILDESLDYPDPNLDPAQERQLQRQLDAEQIQFDDPASPDIERPQRAPVPADVIDDIESFKQQIRREQGHPQPETKGQLKPVKLSGDPTRLRLTPEQQAQLPGYLMTVHVYDQDATKRFVLINTLKYHEGEQTREGLRIERILTDGAVLSYQGNPFYVAR